MCVGEKRHLVIPPELGYGDQTSTGVPAGATLEYDVELVKIGRVKAPEANVFDEMDTDGDRRISYDEMELWFQTKHPKRYPGIPPLLFEKQDVNMVNPKSLPAASRPLSTRWALTMTMTVLGSIYLLRRVQWSQGTTSDSFPRRRPVEQATLSRRRVCI